MILSRERMFCLKQFSDFGWSCGRGDWDGVAKWQKHIQMLVKRGFLEADEYGLFRITDAGREALKGSHP